MSDEILSKNKNRKKRTWASAIQAARMRILLGIYGYKYLALPRKDGYTPLKAAVALENKSLVEKMLSYFNKEKRDSRIKMRHLELGLRQALKNESPEMAKTLIEHGAILSQETLQELVIQNNVQAINLAIDVGLKGNQTNLLQDIFLMSIENNKPEIIALCETHGIKSDPPQEFLKNLMVLFITKKKAGYLEQAISMGVDPDLKLGQPGCHDTLLIYAVSHNDLPLVQRLVEAGANINQSAGNVSRKSPLQIAQDHQYKDIVKYFIDMGADLNIKATFGETPINTAIMHDDKEMVDYLIEKGARFDAPSEEPPLFFAINHGASHEMIKHLYGRDPEVKNERNLTALDYAIKEKKPKAVLALLEDHPNMQETAMFLAIESDSLDVVKMLLESFHIKVSAEMLTQSLGFRNNHNIAATLLETKVDVSGVSNNGGGVGLLPLNVAIKNKVSKDIISQILRTVDYDLNLQDKNKETALQLAIKNSDFELAEDLMRRGANKLAISRDEIESDVFFDRVDRLEFLLKHRACIIPELTDNTLSKLAAKAKGETKELIIAAIKPGNPKASVYDFANLLEACHKNDINTIINYKENNMLDIQNKHGNTVLQYAIKNDQIKIVKLLLENGASHEISSNSKKSPLLNAIIQGKSDMANILIEHGAKLDEVSVLVFAIQSMNKSYVENTVNFLKVHGTDFRGLLKNPSVIDALKSTKQASAKLGERYEGLLKRLETEAPGYQEPPRAKQ